MHKFTTNAFCKSNRESLAIIIIATNKYTLLAMRFIHQWKKHYMGIMKVDFHVFGDRPIPGTIHHPISDRHEWRKLANLKLRVIEGYDRIIVADADTAIRKNFDDQFLSQDLFFVQHPEPLYDNWEDNLASSCWIPNPIDGWVQTHLFGGTYKSMKQLTDYCIPLLNADLSQNIYMKSADEAYINKYLHDRNPSRTTYRYKDIPFDFNDKGNGPTLKLLQEPLCGVPMKTIKRWIIEINETQSEWDIIHNGILLNGRLLAP